MKIKIFGVGCFAIMAVVVMGAMAFISDPVQFIGVLIQLFDPDIFKE